MTFEVPYGQAQVRIRCVYHSCDVLFHPDEDSDGVLDQLQWLCSRAQDEKRTHRVAISQLEWLARHDATQRAEEAGEDAVLYVASGAASNPENWLLPYRDRIAKLVDASDKIDEACLASWIVILEEKCDTL